MARCRKPEVIALLPADGTTSFVREKLDDAQRAGVGPVLHSKAMEKEARFRRADSTGFLPVDLKRVTHIAKLQTHRRSIGIRGLPMAITVS